MSNRRQRRNADARILEKRMQYAGGGGAPFGNLPQVAPFNQNKGGGGGYGLGEKGAKPASGQTPVTNPFYLPKQTGLNIISQSFPSSYYVEWSLSSWRAACDQATLMGYPVSYATLTTWAFECSPFIQSLFNAIGRAIDAIPFFVLDKKGNHIDPATLELCNKPWHIQLRREIAFSFFWGFSGLNFDPLQEKVYKYPMQQLDPINRMLRQSTYNFSDGILFDSAPNLLFIQPSTSYESFLGMMQPITRRFIQTNLNDNNWIAAGRRLAFPLATFGYPQDDGAVDSSGNALNPFKSQAEVLAANIDPTQGLVYPYTMAPDGSIQKSIEIDFENPGSSNGMWKIYSEFNEDAKNEIREMVLGGILTATTGKNGNRNLGEIQENKFDTAILSIATFVESVLNSDFIPKISRFYSGLPDGWSFSFDKSKKWTLDELERLSTILNQSGKRFTSEFFYDFGLSPDFIEDGPVTTSNAPFDDTGLYSRPTYMLASEKKNWL